MRNKDKSGTKQKNGENYKALYNISQIIYRGKFTILLAVMYEHVGDVESKPITF